MHKDQSVDRLLRRATSPPEGPQLTENCLDPQTLAAWAEGSLTAAERTAAEMHAADCDRCLAMVAAIARTTPPAAPPERSSWISLRWLVPLTSAAVAVTAWVVVQGPQRAPTQMAPAAQSEHRAKPESAPAQQVAQAPAAQAEPRAANTADQRRAPAERDAGAREDAFAKAEAKSPALSRDAAAKSLKDSAEKSTAHVDSLQALPGRPAAAPSAPAQTAAAAAPPAPAAPLRKEGTVEERQSFRTEQVPPVVIASPDPNVRWRLTGRIVERSIDGGRTWTPQSIDTGTQLSAGSAPSRDVCWIVGQSGNVLLSTDGRTWRRLSFPDGTANLVTVSAADATSATVTTADGRTYRTSDGGRTWTLQETPGAPF